MVLKSFKKNNLIRLFKYCTTINTVNNINAMNYNINAMNYNNNNVIKINNINAMNYNNNNVIKVNIFNNYYYNQPQFMNNTFKITNIDNINNNIIHNFINSEIKEKEKNFNNVLFDNISCKIEDIKEDELYNDIDQAYNKKSKFYLPSELFTEDDNCVLNNDFKEEDYENYPYIEKNKKKKKQKQQRQQRQKKQQTKLKPCNIKKGDWLCKYCNNLNFGFRYICNNCFKLKDALGI